MAEESVIPAVPAVPVAPAAPVVEPTASLVDPNAVPAAPAIIPAPAVAPVAPSIIPAEPIPDPKWYLSEGVAGQGEVPDWFKADKYKSADKQAEAYKALEERFGAFTGAPEDGVYKINMPEGFVGEFDTSHQLFQDLNKWAGESQLSQTAYDNVIGMLTRYEASMLPDMGEIKKQLGDNADARISSVSQWAKSNLTEPEYEAFREAQTGLNAGAVFKAMEAVIARTRQVAMPKAGDDVSGAVATGLEEINAMQAKLGEDGRRIYEHDSAYRDMVEKKRFAFFAAQG